MSIVFGQHYSTLFYILFQEHYIVLHSIRSNINQAFLYIIATSAMLQRHSIPRTLHCSTFYSKNNQRSTKRLFTSLLLRRCDYWEKYSTISQHRSTFNSKNNQPTVCLQAQYIRTVIHLHCFTLFSKLNTPIRPYFGDDGQLSHR
jgi:hypothetical protein